MPLIKGELIRHCTDNYVLTSGQSTAIAMIDDFLSSDEKCFLLKGYAGTGKTFLTRCIVEFLSRERVNVKLMAPTGRAARILHEKTGAKATTVHKGIYNLDDLKEEMTIKNNKEKYRFYFAISYGIESTSCLFLIDEASMIGDTHSEHDFFQFGSGRLLNDIMGALALRNEKRDVKLLFIGDDAQLPPIGNNLSGALDPMYLEKNFEVSPMSYTLTEIKRQSGESDVLTIAGYLRGRLQSPSATRFRLPETGSDIVRCDSKRAEDHYLEKYHAKGPEKVIMILQRNADVFDSNMSIRSRLYGGKVDIQENERLVISKNNYWQNVELLNGTFVTVTKVYDEVVTRANIPSYDANGESKKIDLAYQKLDIKVPLIGGEVIIPCFILQNHLFSKARDLSYEENIAGYIDFKIRHPHLKPGTAEFKETLKNDPYFNALQVKFGYAITCHKSQGGEWETVILNMDHTNSPLSEDYLRWAYTAVTRASDHLILYNIPTYTPYERMTFKMGQPRKEIGRRPDQANDFYLEIGDTETAFMEKYGLANSLPFLKQKYLTLVAQLKDTGIEILSRTAHNYQEQYEFGRDNAKVKIQFFYDGKNIFTRISFAGKQNDAALEKEMKEIVNRPVNVLIKSATDAKGPVEDESQPDVPEFEQEQHAQLYKDLKELLNRKEVDIKNIRHENYAEVYQFERRDEEAAIRFYYDGRGRFTTVLMMEEDCNSAELITDIAAILDQLKTTTDDPI